MSTENAVAGTAARTLSAGWPAMKPFTFRASVGERIRAARGVITQAKLAELLGVHENTVSKMERGVTLPDALQLVNLSRLLDRPVTWFLPGSQGDVSEPDVIDATEGSLQAVERRGLVHVPVFDLRATSPVDPFADPVAMRGSHPLEVGYLRNDLGIDHNDLALVRVRGPSMEPYVHPGDLVLVDRGDRAIHTDGPHLVRYGGAPLFKLLQRQPGGLVRVVDCNAVAGFEVSLSDGPGDFQVLGRVRWAGVTFR